MGGVSFALSLFACYNPPSPPPPQLFYHPPLSPGTVVTQRFLLKVRNEQFHALPARKLFLAFVFPGIFPFQLRSRERLIPIPSLIKLSGAAVIFTIFFPELLRRTTFEGGRSREEFSLQCLDWLCAGRMKMNTLGQCDCSRQLFTFCLVSST